MSAFVASSAMVLPALLALAPTAIAQDAPPVAPATGHSFVTDPAVSSSGRARASS